jgi:hypothetical protein
VEFARKYSSWKAQQFISTVKSALENLMRRSRMGSMT